MRTVIVAASGFERSVDFNSLKMVSKGGIRAESGSFPSGMGPVKLLYCTLSGVKYSDEVAHVVNRLSGIGPSLSFIRRRWRSFLVSGPSLKDCKGNSALFVNISKTRQPKLHISSFRSNLLARMNSGDLKSNSVMTFFGGSAMKNASNLLGCLCLKIVWRSCK